MFSFFISLTVFYFLSFWHPIYSLCIALNAYILHHIHRSWLFSIITLIGLRVWKLCNRRFDQAKQLNGYFSYRNWFIGYATFLGKISASFCIAIIILIPCTLLSFNDLQITICYENVFIVEKQLFVVKGKTWITWPHKTFCCRNLTRLCIRMTHMYFSCKPYFLLLDRFWRMGFQRCTFLIHMDLQSYYSQSSSKLQLFLWQSNRFVFHSDSSFAHHDS